MLKEDELVKLPMPPATLVCTVQYRTLLPIFHAAKHNKNTIVSKKGKRYNVTLCDNVTQCSTMVPLA